MAEEPRSPVAVRIIRAYATEEEFLSRELETLTRTSVSLLGAPQKPQGVVLRFELALKGGEPLLRGEGRVVGFKAASGDAESALTLRFTRLDARSKALVDRAAAIREAKNRPQAPKDAGTAAAPPAGQPPSAPQDATPPTMRAAQRGPSPSGRKPRGDGSKSVAPAAQPPAEGPPTARPPIDPDAAPETTPSIPPPPPSSSRTVVAFTIPSGSLPEDSEDATVAPRASPTFAGEGAGESEEVAGPEGERVQAVVGASSSEPGEAEGPTTSVATPSSALLSSGPPFLPLPPPPPDRDAPLRASSCRGHPEALACVRCGSLGRCPGAPRAAVSGTAPLPA